MKLVTKIVVCAAALFLLACASGPMVPPYPTCEVDAHCKQHSELCVKGVCQECRTDAQCLETGARCMDNECVGKGG
jgi:hypothetical protein